MPSGKEIASAILRTALPLIRFQNRSAIRILMYHRFAGMEREFAAQCDHLLKHYRPISLSGAMQEPGSNAVVITVDDGYRDFYASAFPILRSRGIPAIVFLVTDFLDRRGWIWTEQVRYVVERTSVQQFDVAGVRVSREPGASAALKEKLKTMPNSTRLTAIEELQRNARVQIPADPPAGSEPLTWDEVREMARAGIEFGGHTRTHPILSRVDSIDQLDAEIAGCKARIEAELQSSVHHFCYPNGRLEDVNPEVIQATRRAGYRSAVSTVVGLNRSGADPFLLRRLGVNPDVPMAWFERTVAGFTRG